MSDNLPSVTVLIAARPGQTEIKAVAAARALDYPPDKLDIIVARGRQPSAQRNAALPGARGELIYFLDDDSMPEPGNLRRALAQFRAPEVKMAGGPNLCPPDAPPLEHVFALVLASWLAFGPSRARYTPVGEVRESSEKELILCNLLARRQDLLALGGFNEALYPNEENALMDELQKRGGKLIYDPALVVYRRPRSNLRAFARMLMTYGRGRAEQFRVHPTPGSALNFVPPLFDAYLLAAAVAAVWTGPLVFAPLIPYLGAVLIQAATVRSGPGIAAAAQPGWGAMLFRRAGVALLIVLTHVLYGAGFWRGLFTRLSLQGQRPAHAVTLETLTR